MTNTERNEILKRNRFDLQQMTPEMKANKKLFDDLAEYFRFDHEVSDYEED